MKELELRLEHDSREGGVSVKHDCMDAGGTSPRMDEVESRQERRPRATHGAVAEEARTE